MQEMCIYQKCLYSKYFVYDLQGVIHETNWYCPSCLTEIFPFNCIIDQGEFLEALSDPLPESSRADFLIAYLN